MNSQIRRETALILQFPPPGARSRIGARVQATRKQSHVVSEVAVPGYGEAWYHQEAIAEANRPRKS